MLVNSQFLKTNVFIKLSQNIMTNCPPLTPDTHSTYMTNPTIVYPVKMEYGWNFRISGLKMMVKSGLEKIFWNSSMCKPFSIKWIYLIERRSFDQKNKFSKKMTWCAHGVNFQKSSCGISTYDKWNFKPQISSIFHFDWVSDGQMAHVLGVK